MRLRDKLLLAFLLPLGLALVVSWAVHAALASSLATGRWVNHTLQVIATIREQREVIQEAVAALRGYVVSRDPGLLAGYSRAQGRFGEVNRRLLEQVSDNPPQVERVRELAERFERWQREIATPMAQAAQNGQSVPDPRLIQSQEQLGQIQQVAQALEAAEQALLQERLAASEAAAQQVRWLAMAGPTLSLILAMGLVLGLILRPLRRIQTLSRVAQTLGEGDLTLRAPADSADEVGHLAQTLNRMASNLENTQSVLQSSLRRVELLYKASEALIGTGSLAQMLQRLVDVIAQALPADRATLMVMDLEQRRVVHSVRGGVGAGEVAEVGFEELMQGLTGWALRELMPVFSPKGEPDPRESESPEAQRHTQTNRGSIIVVPLHYQGRKLGTVTVINRPDQPDFTAEDVELLLAIANQASVAIVNAEFFSAATRHARELELLGQVQEVMAKNLELPLLLKAVVEAVADTFGYRLVSLYLLEGEELVLKHQRGYDRVFERIPLGQGIVSKVVRSAQAVLLEDVREDPDFLEALEGIVSEVCVPLFEQGRVAGILNIETTKEQRLGPNDLRLMQAVAAQVTLALERSRLYEALAKQVADLEAERGFERELNRLSSLLQACLSLEEAAEVIAHVAPRLFEGGGGAVFGFNPSRNLVEVLASWGGYMPETFEPDACWALRRGQPHWIANCQSGLVCDHLKGAPLTSYVCQPLVAQGETLGLLHLNDKNQALDMSERRKQRVALVSDQLALAIANLRLRETLRRQSIRDPLTGLFNRRYLEETLQREIFRAQRGQRPLSLLFFDIDHFKRFNDTHGHEAGDLVLQALGHLLRSFFRTEDVPCRYGGEEFVVILPDAQLEDARRRGEQLREAVKRIALNHQGKALEAISLSIGVATYPEHGESPEALLTMADGALYKAKRSGRDRVVVAE